ncbi:MAG: hypothetical protein ACOY31_11645 [Bacillota bacterium]
MFFLFVDIKGKLLGILKLLLALAIMLILASQMGYAIEQAGETYRRWINREHPHGNPIKVFSDIDESVLNNDDRMLIKIRKYFRVREEENIPTGNDNNME